MKAGDVYKEKASSLRLAGDHPAGCQWSSGRLLGGARFCFIPLGASSADTTFMCHTESTVSVPLPPGVQYGVKFVCF
jgi:hypothetical protein